MTRKAMLNRLRARAMQGLVIAAGLLAGQGVWAQTGERSTLESFPFEPLEGDALAEAVISGSLDAPAAGESIEVPDELKQRKPGVADPFDTREDLGRFNVPAAYNLRPEPAAVGGRTYNYDYFFGTPR